MFGPENPPICGHDRFGPGNHRDQRKHAQAPWVSGKGLPFAVVAQVSHPCGCGEEQKEVYSIQRLCPENLSGIIQMGFITSEGWPNREKIKLLFGGIVYGFARLLQMVVTYSKGIEEERLFGNNINF